jgi:hypothetical protein
MMINQNDSLVGAEQANCSPATFNIVGVDDFSSVK